MKTHSPLCAVLGALLFATAPAPADEWASLSGIGDHVVLKPGQTALIVGASERLVVHFDKPGSPRARFRVTSLEPCRGRGWFHSTAARYRRLPGDVEVGMASPLPVAGPGRLEVRSPGVLSMQIVEAR